MTFYLKYRPKLIEELDLAQVRQLLKNIVKSGNIPHAFLFSGPKGSGKTSAARILAKIVNCENLNKTLKEPCNKCSVCLSIDRGDNLDIIEIDAASHRGIDDIRVLRDAVKLAPSSAKKKVYIIDEAHMLTNEASNALLKTLEEPPDHVIFILATTNPEKLIETIRSRTVSVPFKKASREEIVRSLLRVAEGENLDIDKETLGVVAASSDGSFRDAAKILEELVISGIKLEKKSVEEYLFKRNVFDPDKFVEILISGSEKEAYFELEKAVENGASIKNITLSILSSLRKILFAKVGIEGEDKNSLSKGEVIELIELVSKSYAEVPYAVLEQIPLELAISEWFANKTHNSGSKVLDSQSLKSVKRREKSDSLKSSKDDKDSKSEEGDKKDISSGDFDIRAKMDENVWKKILEEIKRNNTSTEALLRAARPLSCDSKTLTLGVYYKFHKEKLETQPHRNVMEKVLQNVTGESLRVVCKLTQPPLRNSLQNEKSNLGSDDKVSVEDETVLTESDDEEIVRIAKEIFGS